MADNEISSISDLLRILTNLGEPAEGHTRFFRGQGNADWEVLPGIYRNQKLIENEDKIIKEALLNCPDDFSPTDTLLEKLVKLQHYGYPTRLLDLTANALVALYFASLKVEDEAGRLKDGELIILDIPYEEIKYDDSDRASILSALSLQRYDFDLLEITQDLNIDINNFSELASLNQNYKEKQADFESIYNNSRGFKKAIDSLLKKHDISLKDYLSERRHQAISDLTLKVINDDKNMIKLLQIIRQDKPSFRPSIIIDDIQKVLCVKVKLNNSRISRQQGAFLIFGMAKQKNIPALIPEIWQREINGNKIIIKAESKARILQELKAFGISKQTLFPELESQASEIIAQYSK
jgi:hypothetical protein